MPFGKTVATHVQVGLLTTPAAGVVAIDLLCDGGSRPNPGTSRPLVHDGSTFLPVPIRRRGTNHGAVYDAVDLALGHASKVGATDVTITLLSKLVWGHLTGNEGCKRLVSRRDHAVTVASKFSRVTWILVVPPIAIRNISIHTPHALRRLARRRAPLISPVRRSSYATLGGSAGRSVAAGAPGSTSKPTSALTTRQKVTAGAGKSGPAQAPPGP